MFSKRSAVEFSLLGILHICMMYILLLQNENGTYIAFAYYGLYVFSSFAIIGTFWDTYQFKLGASAILIGGFFTIIIDIKDIFDYLLHLSGYDVSNPNIIGFIVFLGAFILSAVNIIGIILKKIKFSFLRLFSSIMCIAAFFLGILFHQVIISSHLQYSLNARGFETTNIISNINQHEILKGYCLSNKLLCVSASNEQFEDKLDKLSQVMPSIGDAKNSILDVHNTIKQNEVAHFGYYHTTKADDFYIIEVVVSKGHSYLLVDNAIHQTNIFFAAKVFLYLYQVFIATWFLFGTMLIGMHQNAINKKSK